MATVVAGWWAESGGGQGNTDDVRPLVRLLAMGYICFVGFTRFVLEEGCRRWRDTVLDIRGCAVEVR